MTSRSADHVTPAFAAGPALAITLAAAMALTLSMPLPAPARGKGSIAPPATTPGSMSLENAERYCEEERQRADQWLAWAAEKRRECKATKGGADARGACLQQSMAQLDAFEREYSEIVLDQVRNLRGDHPVVVAILKRLKSHRDLASNILQRDDADPEMLASQLKRSCMTSAQQPLARSP